MKIIPLIILNLLIIFFINKFRLIISQKLKLIDIPDKIRKFHKTSTPLLGGIMLYLNLILLNLNSFLFDQYNKVNLLILIITSFCFFVGLIDDIFKLSYKYKFVFLFFVFYFLIAFQPELQITEIYFSTFNKFIFLGDYSILFTVICLLLLCNAINLIDGINGLCILVSIIIFSWILFTFKNVNFIYIIIISLTFILLFNLKGNVFLGDSGSLLLGSLIGLSDSGSLLLGSLIGLLLINNYNNELILRDFQVEDIFIVLMLPGIDMLRVFILRIVNKKNPFSSDRNHLHYLLLDKNFKLHQILFIIISLSLLPIIISHLTNILPIFIILCSLIAYMFVIFLIKKFQINKTN